MVELDYDQVLEELINISKKPDICEFPEILDRYLETVALNGDIVFPWSKVKPFLRRKLEIVMEDFHQQYPLNESQLREPNSDPFNFDNLKSNILKCLDWFYAAPFTIQRLCELLIAPYKHYRRTDKFMRGLEKNVVVVSTVQPRPNKYATPETMEKQPSFRDLYPQFNSNSSSPSNNMSSSSSSTSSASPSGLINGIEANNVHNVPGSTFESAYVNSMPHISNSSNLFYSDNASQHSPNILNNHPHHTSHILDPINDSSSSLHHLPHSHPHHHHTLQHQSHLAPLQQLDSFTNVFASTTSHLTHLTNSNYPLNNTHLSNGGTNNALMSSSSQSDLELRNLWSSNSEDRVIRNSSFDPLLHNDPLAANDENENIIVDDDYEDEAEEDETKEETGNVSQTQDSDSANEDKDSLFHSDSSCSTDSSASNETYGEANKSETKDLSNKETKSPQKSSIVETEQLDDIANKKRSSPTPEADEAHKSEETIKSETVQEEENDEQDTTDDSDSSVQVKEDLVASSLLPLKKPKLELELSSSDNSADDQISETVELTEQSGESVCSSSVEAEKPSVESQISQIHSVGVESVEGSQVSDDSCKDNEVPMDFSNSTGLANLQNECEQQPEQQKSADNQCRDTEKSDQEVDKSDTTDQQPVVGDTMMAIDDPVDEPMDQE